MAKKDYNLFALQGQEVDDLTFRDEMKEAGIDIPIDLVNTPEINKFVIDEIYKQNVTQLQTKENPLTGEFFTPKEATEEAAKLKSEALATIRRFTKADSK